MLKINQKAYWQYTLDSHRKLESHFAKLDADYPGCGFGKTAEYHRNEANEAAAKLAAIA